MNFFTKYQLKKLQKKVRYLYEKRERGENIDLKNEIKAILNLAQLYDAHAYDKDLPKAAIHALEAYRSAAILGDVKAQYEFGKRQLDNGKFWEEWSKGMFGLSIHKGYARQHFDEAFTYLKLAEEGGNPLAKRLHGLAYINGWGVPQNKEKGFKLIVDSIEEEKVWHKATQIFTELGLNTPEFFSSMMAIKEKRGN